MNRANYFLAIGFILIASASISRADQNISPSLLFQRNTPHSPAKNTDTQHQTTASVTIRFSTDLTSDMIAEIERHGVTFSRIEGRIMNTGTIYPAVVVLDSLETIADLPDVLYIEDSNRFKRIPTLDVSNPIVQGEQAWTLLSNGMPIDGTGVIVTNVDTGIDIYNPAFFKADGGSYRWLDVDGNGVITRGVDAVDLNDNGSADSNEILDFIDATVKYHDAPGLLDGEYSSGVFDAGFDWLYNDANTNGEREFGANFGETAPSYGEPFFVICDTNGNDQLDTNELITMLGTSKIIAVYDADGIHRRGIDLLESRDDVINHGTPAAGIVLGQTPGRRFTGIAPGAEIIAINRTDLPNDDFSIEAGISWAVEQGADMVMYEFGSWIGEFLDGTSSLETIIDNLYADGIHQFTASGNLAGPSRKKHAQFELGYNEYQSVSFIAPGSPYEIHSIQLSILWRAYKFRSPVPELEIRLSDGSTHTIYVDAKPHTIGSYTYLCGQSKSPVTTSDTATYLIDLFVYTQDESVFNADTFSLNFRWPSSRVTPMSFDIYIADDVSGWAGGAQFTDEIIITDDGTVTSPGTANSGITVGAFTPRGYRSRSGMIGDIADFSSWGKTIDGRIAVDLTAPSPVIFTPSSRNGISSAAGYLDFNGTSAALPFVVGCAALIEQAAPSITSDELYTVLTQYAQQDDFTGDIIPNDTWGYGKVKVYDALVGSHMAEPTIVSEHPVSFSLSDPYPNPFNSSTTINITSEIPLSDTETMEVFNLLGQHVRTISINIDFQSYGTFIWDGCDDTGSPVSTGIYLFNVSTPAGIASTRAVLLK